MFVRGGRTNFELWFRRDTTKQYNHVITLSASVLLLPISSRSTCVLMFGRFFSFLLLMEWHKYSPPDPQHDIQYQKMLLSQSTENELRTAWHFSLNASFPSHHQFLMPHHHSSELGLPMRNKMLVDPNAWLEENEGVIYEQMHKVRSKQKKKNRNI